MILNIAKDKVDSSAAASKFDWVRHSYYDIMDDLWWSVGLKLNNKIKL